MISIQTIESNRNKSCILPCSIHSPPPPLPLLPTPIIGSLWMKCVSYRVTLIKSPFSPPPLLYPNLHLNSMPYPPPFPLPPYTPDTPSPLTHIFPLQTSSPFPPPLPLPPSQSLSLHPPPPAPVLANNWRLGRLPRRCSGQRVRRYRLASRDPTSGRR